MCSDAVVPEVVVGNSLGSILVEDERHLHGGLQPKLDCSLPPLHACHSSARSVLRGEVEGTKDLLVPREFSFIRSTGPYGWFCVLLLLRCRARLSHVG